jgi:hypothetical protein
VSAVSLVPRRRPARIALQEPREEFVEAVERDHAAFVQERLVVSSGNTISS